MDLEPRQEDLAGRARREKWIRENDGIVDTYVEDLSSDMNQNQWDDENVYDCNPYNDPEGVGSHAFEDHER